MFCVIQEVATKTVPAGEPKGIEVYESRWTADGKEFCSYEYRNSAERLNRCILFSCAPAATGYFKISLA